jgi:hypothetical protein
MWKNLKQVQPIKRVKTLVYIIVALPVGAICSLALFLVLSITFDFQISTEREFFNDLIVSLVVCAGIFTAFFLLRYGLRHIAPSAAAVQQEDLRATILLLRSFADENIKIPRRINRFIGFYMLFFPMRLDEFLEENLHSYGPVIAIGRPKESLPPLGAAREYVSDDAWESLVERRIGESQAVVAILGHTEGLAWEMSAIMRLSARHKLRLIIPPLLRASEVIERWEKMSTALETRSELPVNAAVVFWEGDSMKVLTARRFYRFVDGYRIALAFAFKGLSESFS